MRKNCLRIFFREKFVRAENCVSIIMRSNRSTFRIRWNVWSRRESGWFLMSSFYLSWACSTRKKREPDRKTGLWWNIRSSWKIWFRSFRMNWREHKDEHCMMWRKICRDRMPCSVWFRETWVPVKRFWLFWQWRGAHRMDISLPSWHRRKYLHSSIMKHSRNSVSSLDCIFR